MYRYWVGDENGRLGSGRDRRIHTSLQSFPFVEAIQPPTDANFSNLPAERATVCTVSNVYRHFCLDVCQAA